MKVFKKFRKKIIVSRATGWINDKLDEIKVNLETIPEINAINKVSDEDVNFLRSQMKEVQDFIGSKDLPIVDYPDIITKIQSITSDLSALGIRVDNLEELLETTLLELDKVSNGALVSVSTGNYTFNYTLWSQVTNEFDLINTGRVDTASVPIFVLKAKAGKTFSELIIKHQFYYYLENISNNETQDFSIISYNNLADANAGTNPNNILVKNFNLTPEMNMKVNEFELNKTLKAGVDETKYYEMSFKTTTTNGFDAQLYGSDGGYNTLIKWETPQDGTLPTIIYDNLVQNTSDVTGATQKDVNNQLNTDITTNTTNIDLKQNKIDSFVKGDNIIESGNDIFGLRFSATNVDALGSKEIFFRLYQDGSNHNQVLIRSIQADETDIPYAPLDERSIVTKKYVDDRDALTTLFDNPTNPYGSSAVTSESMRNFRKIRVTGYWRNNFAFTFVEMVDSELIDGYALWNSYVEFTNETTLNTKTGDFSVRKIIGIGRK